MAAGVLFSWMTLGSDSNVLLLLILDEPIPGNLGPGPGSARNVNEQAVLSMTVKGNEPTARDPEPLGTQGPRDPGTQYSHILNHRTQHPKPLETHALHGSDISEYFRFLK